MTVRNILAFAKCFLCAAMHRTLLLPLPRYWDALERIDFDSLLSNEELFENPLYVHRQSLAYCKLLHAATFSAQHESLIKEFLCSSAGGETLPVRPFWF